MIDEGPFQNITLLHAEPGGLAVLTGTALASIDEVDIRDGGKLFFITLTDAEWVPVLDEFFLPLFDTKRQDIIDGLNSAQSETFGWNNEVRDNLAVTAIVRNSDTVVRVFLSAESAYDISVDETITVTVPASALAVLDSPITATPTIEIAWSTELPYFWEYSSDTAPFGLSHFKSASIPYSGSFFTTIELESGEFLDFDNSPVFGGPFGDFWQRSSGDQVFTIRDNGSTAQYFISDGSDASATRTEIATLFSISTDLDQTCDKS